MSRRRSQPFRPYRRSPRSAKTERSLPPLKTPFEPPVYVLGDIVYCMDNSDRAITKIESKEYEWCYCWRLVIGQGEGCTMEGTLVLFDVFKD